MTWSSHAPARPLRAALVLVTLAAGALAAVAPVGATAPLSAQRAATPADADHVPQAILNAVACPSAGACVAVGRYEGPHGSEALIDTEAYGNWQGTQTVTLPADALDGANGVLNGVACTSVGNCVAVGQYETTQSTSSPSISVVEAPMTVTESGGVWGAARRAPLPPGATTSSVTALNAVSCPKAGACVAVGQFTTAVGDEAVIVRQKAGTWGGARVPQLPKWAKSNFITQLDGVSCLAVGYCVAVGQFVTRAPARQPLVVIEAKGVWQRGRAAAVPTTRRNPWGGLFAVTCRSWGDCVAVGVYEGLTGGGQGLIVTEKSGHWITPVTAKLPPVTKTSSMSDQLLGVSCPAAGRCYAVGQYTDKAVDQGVVLTEVKGFWSLGQIAPRPADASSPPYVGLNGVACPTTTSCAMVGQYQAGLGQPALVVTR
jgi:hypothetical protein